MPKLNEMLPLLVFALVIILVVLEGHEGITFNISPDAWNLLNIILPIGFSFSIINSALSRMKKE